MPKNIIQTIKLVNEEITVTNQTENPTFLQMCDNLIDKLTDEYKRNKDDIQKLKKQYLLDIKAAKSKKNINLVKKAESGITMAQKVPLPLCKLLGLETDTTISRIELTKKIYALLEDRELYYKNDKRVFRADNDFMVAFSLTESVNESVDPKDKNGFNFYTLQSYIKKCYQDEKNPV
jgi:hypothetical protein